MIPNEDQPKTKSTEERKKDPTPEKNTDPSDETSSSSKEMCAYCETPTTVSSKFYNITIMGDLEYIGRRLNHLGPKKNQFCERVCKRHYDLNLKRDKAQRQYNAKRERLPGIDMILGVTKKQRVVSSSAPHPHPPPLTPPDYNPSSKQTSRIGTWYPTFIGSLQETRPGMMTPPQSLGQPAVSMIPQTTQFTCATTTGGVGKGGMQWVWETPNIPGTTSGPGPGELNVGGTLPIPTESVLAAKPDSNPTGNPVDPEVEEPFSVDLVASHMSKILSLFSTDSTEHINIFESIKQRAAQQQDIPYAIINALCSYTYNVISKIRQAEMNEKRTQIQLQSSIRDLMVMLLKREHREDVLLKGDDEIDALFIEWVNLQKSTQAQ